MDSFKLKCFFKLSFINSKGRATEEKQISY